MQSKYQLVEQGVHRKNLIRLSRRCYCATPEAIWSLAGIQKLDSSSANHPVTVTILFFLCPVWCTKRPF